MNSLHILSCMCLLNYVYSCLRLFFQLLNMCQNNERRCCLNKQTILTRPKNKLHVFIGSVSNTKTVKKCQQKLAVILCRIKWKNFDMQTDISYLLNLLRK